MWDQAFQTTAMTTQTIYSVSEFVKFLEECKQRRATSSAPMIFRGHSRASYRLIPSAFRLLSAQLSVDGNPVPRSANAAEIRELEELELKMLKRFKRRALPYLAKHPSDDDDWQWMAMAQHHGLPTRLLDWTLHAAAALYFAVEREENGGEDSAIFCVERPVEIEKHTGPGPFMVKEVMLFRPPHIVSRITAQRSCFTIHPSDYLARKYEWTKNLIKLIIPAACREDIRDTLRMLGTHRASLFPDLDGVAAYIRGRAGFKL